MKKIILLILISYSIFGQNNNKPLDWLNLDKINSHKDFLIPVNYKTFATFKIENINKFLNKVEISGKGFNLETPVPTELQQLFRLSKDEQKSQQDNSKANAATEDIKVANFEMKNISKSMRANDLTKEIDILTKLCDDYYTKANQLKLKLFDLKKLKFELINIAQKEVSFNEIKNEIQTIPTIENPSILYKDFLTLYAEVEIHYQKAVQLATDDEEKTKIEQALEKIEKSFEIFSEENILNLYNELFYLKSELENVNNFIAIAPPIQMYGDYVEYKIKVTPSKTNTLGAYKTPVEINFIIPTKGGLKVDFSVGPTMSFGKNAKDEKYYLETSSNVGKSFLRQRDNNNVAIPGLAAMMHFFNRDPDEKTFGGLFGVGAGFQDIKDVNLSFYLGGSYILGKSQKLFLNAGLSFFKVDRIKSDEYLSDKEYTTLDFDTNNVVEKVFKTSFFISLSYNFAKRVDN